MKIDEILELYQLISLGNENIDSRKRSMALRKKGLKLSSSMVKIAFDTRRINQETEFMPRHNLRNYQRSEPFISEDLAEKLINFAKLKNILEDLKNQYGRLPEWQDSNCRVLLSTLNNGLRSIQQDGDYTSCQPAMGSLDYIEEILQMRYRLSFDDLTKLSEVDLKKSLLSKDENLLHKNVNDMLITKSDVSNQSYNSLMEKMFSNIKESVDIKLDKMQVPDLLLEKLFGNVKASSENPEVERVVTITIKDSVKDKDNIKKES